MHQRTANLLGAAALNVTDLVMAEMRETDLGSSAGSALIALAEAPDLTVTDLARRIGLSQPAAARMVDGLADQGLVRRRPMAGRTVSVRLTRTGRRTVDRLLERRGAVLRELVADLDASEQATLAGLLDTVLRAVHKRVEHTTKTPRERIGELVCRQCDRLACRQDDAPCPVSAAQRELERAQQHHTGS